MENLASVDKYAININFNTPKIAILAADVGTTNLKCSLFDENLETIHSTSTKVLSTKIYF